jgi:outer membrane lipoprotein-sorting protein
MRFALLALLLPAFVVAGEGNEAEKLFRQLEKKIRDARALRVVADVKGVGKAREVSFRVEMTVARGNKVRFKAKGETKRDGENKQITAELISDGTKMWATESEQGKVREEEAPKQLGQALSTALSRVGALFGFQAAGDVRGQARDLEKLFAVRDFRMGEAAKVNDRAARVLQYTVEPGPKEIVRVTLYLDAKTLLPLKRVIEVEREKARMTETYTEFTLNPKLDPKTFELPK